MGGEEIGEIDGDFDGEGGVVGSSSLTIVGLTLGESFMTSGSSNLVMVVFDMSKRIVFGFLLDEVVVAIASLNASEISCQSCLMATSPFGLELGSSDLFLFVTLV